MVTLRANLRLSLSSSFSKKLFFVECKTWQLTPHSKSLTLNRFIIKDSYCSRSWEFGEELGSCHKLKFLVSWPTIITFSIVNTFVSYRFLCVTVTSFGKEQLSLNINKNLFPPTNRNEYEPFSHFSLRTIEQKFETKDKRHDYTHHYGFLDFISLKQPNGLRSSKNLQKNL